MPKNKILTILIFSVLALLIVGGWFFYFYSPKPRNEKAPAPESGVLTRLGVTGTGDFKVESLPLAGSFPPPPDLSRPVKITLSLPVETEKAATARIGEISLELKKNPELFDHWLELGRLRKIIGDYEGVRQAWEYASLLLPSNHVSFNNLGELYGYYLKDWAKAEANYKKAVLNGPDQIYIYRNFADFYRFVLNDPEKAKALLEEGIKANPGASEDLQNLLKQF